MFFALVFFFIMRHVAALKILFFVFTAVRIVTDLRTVDTC